MNILGIESSCDETGVALVHASANGTPKLLAHALHSQVEMHQAYGGVVPELASRDHIRRVLPLARQVLFVLHRYPLQSSVAAEQLPVAQVPAFVCVEVPTGQSSTEQTVAAA